MELFSTIIVIIGIAQGVFIGIALIAERTYSSKNNKFIGASLILFSLQGILDLLSFWNLGIKYLWVEIITNFGLQGIVFIPYFLSVLASTNTKLPFPKITLFIPFALSFVYGALATFISILGEKELYWNKLSLNELWSFHWYLNMLFVLVMNVYLFRIINKTGSTYKKHGAYTLWLSFTILIGLWLSINILNLFFSSELYYLIVLTTFWGSFTCFIYWITYKGIVQQRLINEQKSLHLILSQSESKEKKGQATPNTYYEQFIQLIEEDKIYRKADLDRDKVAKKLGISSGYFSTILSQSSDKSFNELLNEYRVEEVKKILKNGSLDHFSLTAIGLEVGFKSKSTFFTNFKNITGSTPNDYKKKFQS